MKLVYSHFQAQTFELLRLPAYSIPTLAFPSILFLFFGVPNAREPMAAGLLTASYAAFAVLGVAFFQFGVGIAESRHSAWESYMRTFPVGPKVRFAARVLSALVFALASASVVGIVALLSTPVRLSVVAWLRLIAALLLGSVPFALLGIALGYWASPKAALPLANLVYLPLSYVGGLWIQPQSLPGVVAKISPFLPSRRYAEVVWSGVLNLPWQMDPWLWLLGYALFFGLFAVIGYRRDEGQNYR